MDVGRVADRGGEINTELAHYPNCRSQRGVFLTARDVTDANRADIAGWQDFFSTTTLPGSDHMAAMLASVVNARWVLTSSVWTAVNVGPFTGKPLVMPARAHLVVDAAGRLIESMVCQDNVTMTIQSHISVLLVAGLGISFAHCKNVSQSNEEIASRPKWHKKKPDSTVQLSDT